MTLSKTEREDRCRRFRDLLDQSGMTVHEVAALLEVGARTVSRWLQQSEASYPTEPMLFYLEHQAQAQAPGIPIEVKIGEVTIATGIATLTGQTASVSAQAGMMSSTITQRS